MARLMHRWISIRTIERATSETPRQARCAKGSTGETEDLECEGNCEGSILTRAFENSGQ
jgi:hypothetical protein